MASPETKTGAPETAAPKRSDFIRDIIDADIASGKYGGQVVTRFPPEPNGYLHIGHAKSICLNFGIANDYGGRCHLRMDDTDPTKENTEYVEAIQRDIRWLGFDWGEHMYYAADYFDKLYDLAIQLIKEGKAYVDSQTEAEIKETRGNLTTPGTISPHRERSVEENLDLFTRMYNGEFPNGAHVLRARLDMANPNMKMRDPLLYRIKHAHHYRAGDKWHIYPMYDYAHPLSDAFEGITYSICTLEFENNRELYDWILDACNIAKPRNQQYEFARLNLNYTVMSKRFFLQLVNEKHVDGWDDPRMMTISGLRRRGVTPEALRSFCATVGIAKANSQVDMAQLEFAIRDDLNPKVSRVMAVLRPLKVVIENYPEGQTETLEGSLYPHDVPLEGSRPIPFGREIYIEQDDFTETPAKGYYRLSPGAEVRLRHAYFIKCESVIKDASGNVTELRCTYDPQTKSGDPNAVNRKVAGTIHWVPANESVAVEARLYDRLYKTENPQGLEDLNPHSLEVISTARVEPWVAQAKPGTHFQFERQGYFYFEPETASGDHRVFNRTVGLKDSWSKQEVKADAPKAEAKPQPKPQEKKPKGDGKPEAKVAPNVTLTPEQETRAAKYVSDLKITDDEAKLISSDDALAALFEAAVASHNNAPGIANWIVNELLRELKERDVASLPFTPQHLGELIALVDDETISNKIAKEVFAEMLKSGANPQDYVAQKELRQISDPAILSPIVERVIANNVDNVAHYKAGKKALFGSFVGQVLKETGGRANPRLVNELVQKLLDN